MILLSSGASNKAKRTIGKIVSRCALVADFSHTGDRAICMQVQRTMLQRLLTCLAFLLALLCERANATRSKHFDPSRHAPLCSGSEVPLSENYDAATADDAAFNAEFKHCFLTVNGVQMHAVEGGKRGGPVAVMLHGWPQSWFEFKRLLPAVARTYRVLAIDLPGLGDSTGVPPSMAKSTLADFIQEYVITRVPRIAKRGLTLIAHDLGVGVAFAYAAKFPHEVRRAVRLKCDSAAAESACRAATR